ncbi:MAG: hypothetical protein WA957_02995 [Alteraurantiacibacter sp.]
MVTETQASHVLALVHERHSAVRQAFDQLLNAFALGEQQRVVVANENFRESLAGLKAVIAGKHWPDWLKKLDQASHLYATRHTNGLSTWRSHLESVIDNSRGLLNESWDFESSVEVLFDINAIIEKAKADHGVDLLYQSVIECLQELINSGEIDSVRASSDLTRMVETLRKVQSSSFSSQVFTWRFASRLVPNIIASYVKRNSITGPIIEAFEQTAAELEVSLASAKNQIGEEALSSASNVLRSGIDLSTSPVWVGLLETHETSSVDEDAEKPH